MCRTLLIRTILIEGIDPFWWIASVCAVRSICAEALLQFSQGLYNSVTAELFPWENNET